MVRNPGHILQGDIGMLPAVLRRELLCGFPDDLHLPDDAILHQHVLLESFLRHAAKVLSVE